MDERKIEQGMELAHYGVENKARLADFLVNGIWSEASLLARYSLDPGGFNFDVDRLTTDIDIARSLNKGVKVLDKHFLGANNPSEDEKLFLTTGMAIAAQEQVSESKDKKKLGDFGRRLIEKAVDTLVGSGKGRVLKLASELTFILAAATSSNTRVSVSDFWTLSNNDRDGKAAVSDVVGKIRFDQELDVGVKPNKFEGEVHTLNSEAFNIVRDIENKYDVKVILPKEYEGEPNLMWDPESLKCLAEGIEELPPAYIKDNDSSPVEIILVRRAGTDNEGVGGGWRRGQIFLFISEAFDPMGIVVNKNYRNIYDTNKTQLKAALLHEWTHLFTKEIRPEVQEEWNLATGWYENNEGWVNNYPDQLLEEAYADKIPSNPWEDIATAASQFAYAKNARYISMSRMNFFLLNASFKNWSALEPFFQ